MRPDPTTAFAAGEIPSATVPQGARVSFDRIAKDYGTLRVLQETSLVIESGEFFALIGPSGSGKSTLLSILAGFAPPSHGRIVVDGQDVVAMPPYRRNIGMVFQNYALFPHMTVAENIGFPLKLRKLPKAEQREAVDRALSMVRLEKMGHRKPGELSGGQQQRVALARAAVYQPRLLLMDEPLGALDKNLREEMQEEIKAFQRRLGATVVYVTHDQQEAAFLADRLAVMNNGTLEQIGSPRELYDAPATHFVATFLGECTLIPVRDLNAVPGQAKEMTAASVDGLRLRVPPPRRRGAGHALCLRPENILLGPAAEQADNRFAGRVEEALFTTGSLRYRVRINGSSTVLTLRVPSHPGAEVLACGSAVTVGWNCDMTVLLAEG